jgi:hypothetical protein
MAAVLFCGASCGAAAKNYRDACDMVAQIDDHTAILVTAVQEQLERNEIEADAHVVGSSIRLSERVEQLHEFCFDEGEDE